MITTINTELVWWTVCLAIITLSIMSLIYLIVESYRYNKETKRLKKEIEEDYLNGWHKVGDEWYYIRTMKNDLYINGKKIY